MKTARLTELDNHLALLACIISKENLSADESLRRLRLIDKIDLTKEDILNIKRNSDCKRNNNKIVLCLDPISYKPIRTYDSLKEASKLIKCDKSTLSKAIKNKSKCRGYRWKYI